MSEIALPRKVREAEELADRLQKELLQPITTEGQGDNAPPPQTTASVAAPATPTDGSPVTPPAANAQPQQQSDDTWEHRYKVLDGKYRAEVPRLSQENRTLKEDLAKLKTRLDELEAERNREPLVKPEEIEEYGPGLVDLARRIAREELATKDNEISKLKAQIESLSSVTTQTVEKDFFKSLGEMVSDWEQLNVDEGFLRWLDGVDDLTGEVRMNLLQSAFGARDAGRTAKFFKAYKQTQQSWAANSNAKLEAQVVPPQSPAPNTPPAKKIWTRPEIKGFYDGVRRGMYSDADAVAIEADINAALIEGRIR